MKPTDHAFLSLCAGCPSRQQHCIGGCLRSVGTPSEWRFHGGRMIRQRLELGAGGTVLLQQSIEGLLPPTLGKEGTSEVAGHEDNIPARVAKKKPIRKRRNASSSGK